MTWSLLSLSHYLTAPYAVSPRMKHAIDSLDLAHEASRSRVGVVSDAPSLQVFLKYCLSRAFDVVVVPSFGALADLGHGELPQLLVADLYTLDHQRRTDLALLDEVYPGVPLLIASQESAAEVRRLPALVLDRPHATLPLPARPADLRRAAAALLGAPTNSPSP